MNFKRSVEWLTKLGKIKLAILAIVVFFAISYVLSFLSAPFEEFEAAAYIGGKGAGAAALLLVPQFMAVKAFYIPDNINSYVSYTISDYSFCNLVVHPGIKYTCIDNVTYKIIYNAFRNGQKINPEFCFKSLLGIPGITTTRSVESSLSIGNCLYSNITDRSANLSNVKICDTLNPEMKEDCHKYMGDVEYCKTKYHTWWEIEYCIEDIADYEKNLSVCLELETIGDDLVKSCIGSTFIANDFSTNECIKLGKYKMSCLVVYADQKESPSVCKILGNYSLIKECIIEATSTTRGNVYFCMQLNENDAKECIFNFSLKYQDSHVCELIEEEDKTNECKEKLFLTPLKVENCMEKHEVLISETPYEKESGCLCQLEHGDNEECDLFLAEKRKDLSFCNESNRLLTVQNECKLISCKLLTSETDIKKCKENLFSESSLTYLQNGDFGFSYQCKRYIAKLTENVSEDLAEKGYRNYVHSFCCFYKEESIDECIMYQAQKRNEPALCNEIKTAVIKNDCISSFD